METPALPDSDEQRVTTDGGSLGSEQGKVTAAQSDASSASSQQPGGFAAFAPFLVMFGVIYLMIGG